MLMIATTIGLVVLLALAGTDVLVDDIGPDELSSMGVGREP